MEVPNLPLDSLLLARIMTDQKVRQHLTRRSHRLFFAVYLNHYIDYQLAPFQKEMFDITEDKATRNAILMNFRDSAKSTIMTLSYPLWTILGEQQKKFVVIIGRTQNAAEQFIYHVKRELEDNDLLRSDLGPFEDDKQWNSRGLILPWHGARIVAASVGESIRGLRWGKYRPQVIILDDIEDREEMRIKDNRDKLERWFAGEISPLGDIDTRMLTVGTLTNPDSLLMRLMKRAENKQYEARVMRQPIIGKDGVIAWPGKFPDLAAIERYKKNSGMDEASWQREMMLNIVPEEWQIVRESDLLYYDRVTKRAEFVGTLVSVDPALGKPNSNYTAILSARLYIIDGQLHVYILPNPVNKKIGVTETLNLTEEIAKTLSGDGDTEVVVEGVAYQGCIAEQLEQRSLNIASFTPRVSKGERLRLTTPYIQSGRVHFPKQGAEELITQILGFGVEADDDLVDAFTMLVIHAFREPPCIPEIFSIGGHAHAAETLTEKFRIHFGRR